MKYTDHFAGMTLMRPYNSQKLLTKKVQQKGKQFIYFKDIIKMQL